MFARLTSISHGNFLKRKTNDTKNRMKQITRSFPTGYHTDKLIIRDRMTTNEKFHLAFIKDIFLLRSEKPSVYGYCS